MKTSQKLISSLLLLMSVSICAIAQTGYYYKGKMIPLYKDNSKICISIPKDYQIPKSVLLKDVDILKEICDDNYDIYVVSHSELDRNEQSASWKENIGRISVSPCYKSEDEKEICLSPYLNVRLKKEQDIDLLVEDAKTLGLRVTKHSKLLPLWYILSVTDISTGNSLECANKLWESGKYASSVPDLCFDTSFYSADALFSEQWGLCNANNPGIDISVESAWEYATGRGVKIAILDSGVDLNHEDLIANLSDLSYDAESGTSPSQCYNDHGTHCAGIAAAVRNNKTGIAGVAPEATILSISNRGLSTTNSHFKWASGITWAYENGADVISNSWGTSGPHQVLDEAIHNALIYGRDGKGCVIVFATGNDGNGIVNYPANSNDSILAVGAIDNQGTRTWFSNYGNGLSLVAPGDTIVSTLPGNRYGGISGTSMACPHVAGVAALILERNPNLSVTEVNHIINSSAKKIPGVSFNIRKPDGSWSLEYGYGLVDAYNSIINTPSVIYIQNEVVTGDRTITADSIFIGKDVTNRKEYGDVVIGQGNIIMNAKETKIKNSTFVPLGTTLEISNH